MQWKYCKTCGYTWDANVTACGRCGPAGELATMGADSIQERKAILDEAAACVCKDRAQQYGPVEDSFADIAAQWNAALRRKLKEQITPSDVALMMAGVKMARLVTAPGHRDNWVDLAGYAACGGAINSPSQKS